MSPRSVIRYCFVAAVLSLALAHGCVLPERTADRTSARADKLRSRYADLASGRFAVIADFEQSAHMELFRVVSPSGAGVSQWLLTGGISETGVRCLRFTLGGPDDALVANNERVAHWFLKRDWRAYDLLIMQIYAPKPKIEVELAIVGGSGQFRSTVHSLLLLEQGWNLVRLDLAEVGEHLPLDDLQELRWSVPAAFSPIRLALDDVVLTNNTKDLVGSSAPGVEGLFVRRQGRRWGIGATGRFDLGFSGGQIVHWYDLASDPDRLNNLLAGGALGPTPIVLPGEGNDDNGVSELPGDFTELGPTVVARQRVVEASPVRIVVESEWRFGRRLAGSVSDTPFQRWSYAIYRTGTVYAHVECTTESGDWRPGEIGLAVARADRGDIDYHVHQPARLEDPGRLRHIAYAYTRSTGSDAPGLLFALHDARRAPVIEFVRDEVNGRAIVIASGGVLRRNADSWSCMLNLWPADNCRGTTPSDLALDYAYPMGRIDVEVGQLVKDDPQDENRDGYNERLGCYVLAPDGAQLRFRLDGSEQRLFSPVFVVKGSAGRQAWVYVNFAVLEPTARDANGDLVFQIPDAIDGPVTVEVYLRPGASGGSA